MFKKRKEKDAHISSLNNNSLSEIKIGIKLSKILIKKLSFLH